jgi:hypothetical protein
MDSHEVEKLTTFGEGLRNSHLGKRTEAASSKIEQVN